MPQWMKAIYLALLNEDGTINNLDDYVAVVICGPDNVDRISFIKKQNVAVDYSKYTTLRKFIQRKIDFPSKHLEYDDVCITP